MKGYRTILPPEQEAYIRDNLKGNGPVLMARLLNKNFGTNYSDTALKSYYKTNKLEHGHCGRFYKGQPGLSHGGGYHQNTRATQFKKGHITHNKLPVGSLIKTTDGYWKEKTADPDTWVYCHYKEWEKHNGPRDTKKSIYFIDGNRDNYQIENLAELTKRQVCMLNQKDFKNFNSREELESALLICELSAAAHKRKEQNRKGKPRGRRRKNDGGAVQN